MVLKRFLGIYDTASTVEKAVSSTTRIRSRMMSRKHSNLTCLEILRKTTKASVSVVDSLAEIQTRYLLNTSLLMLCWSSIVLNF